MGKPGPATNQPEIRWEREISSCSPMVFHNAQWVKPVIRQDHGQSVRSMNEAG